ncbi:MAG TPA: hypothetical protein VGK56_06220 [Anaerolineales bacterium]
MRLFTMIIGGLLFVGMTGLALANPSMLPKHPGYPSGGEFANDTGQQNLTHTQSLMESAKSGDTNMMPTLMDQQGNVEQNQAMTSEHGGAGQSPVVGPNAKTEPSVREAERKTK